jgi:hypothetical protein
VCHKLTVTEKSGVEVIEYVDDVMHVDAFASDSVRPGRRPGPTVQSAAAWRGRRMTRRRRGAADG